MSGKQQNRKTSGTGEKCAGAAYLYYHLPPAIMEKVNGFLALGERKKLALSRQAMAPENVTKTLTAAMTKAIRERRKAAKNTGHHFGWYYLLFHLFFFFALLLSDDRDLILAPAIYGISGFFFLQRRSLAYWRYRFSLLPLEVYEPIFFTLCYAAMVLTVGSLTAGKAAASPDFLFFLLGGFLAPLFEELFFRDVLYEAIASGSAGRSTGGSPFAAVAVTAVGFSLVHLSLQPGLLEFAVYANAGVLLGFLRRLTGRLTFPLAVHIGVNLTMMWL